MKFEYDAEVDAGYVYFEYPLKDGQVRKTTQVNETISLDLDKNGKLLGIEILNASKLLRKESLVTVSD